MTNTKHTPAPWTRKDARTMTHIYSDGIKIASMEIGRYKDEPVERLYQREANARLIAASPKMLNSLERALITIQLLQSAERKRGNHDNAIDAEIDSIRAVIAEAKGE